MKLIIQACTYQEAVRNNIIEGFDKETTIQEAEATIKDITHLVLKEKLEEAAKLLIKKTQYNEGQAFMLIQNIKTDFEEAE